MKSIVIFERRDSEFNVKKVNKIKVLIIVLCYWLFEILFW